MFAGDLALPAKAALAVGLLSGELRSGAGYGTAAAIEQPYGATGGTLVFRRSYMDSETGASGIGLKIRF